MILDCEVREKKKIENEAKIMAKGRQRIEGKGEKRRGKAREMLARAIC
jgi:hypothetical protein